MITIRKNIFETNSSSSHSLVISTKDRGWDYELPVDENGVLTIQFGEFGWGPAVLRDPMSKLSYWVTDHAPRWVDDNEDATWDEIVNDLKHNKEFKELEKTIKRVCPQVKEVKYAQNDDFYKCGYVDHESVGTSYVKDILGFIFSNSQIIVIDNDNDDYFEDYFEDEWDGTPAKKDPERLLEAQTFEELMEE